MGKESDMSPLFLQVGMWAAEVTTPLSNTEFVFSLVGSLFLGLKKKITFIQNFKGMQCFLPIRVTIQKSGPIWIPFYHLCPG